MPDYSRSGQNWAVVLVHGVGETEPIDMLRQVTVELKKQRPDLELDRHVEVQLPPDEEKKLKEAAGARQVGILEKVVNAARGTGAAATTTSVRQHIRHARIGGSHVKFATAYWSDISHFGDSLLKLIGNLALGGMGVRYFADVSTADRNFATRALHLLFKLKIWLLAVLFLPAVLCTLVFSLYSFAAYYLFRDTTLKYQIAFIAMLSLGTVALITSTAIKGFWPIRKERRLALPIFTSLAVMASIVSLVMIIDHKGALGWWTGLDGSIGAWLKKVPLEWYAKMSENQHWRDRMKLVDDTSVYILALQQFQYVCGFVVIVFTAGVLVMLGTMFVLRLGTREQRRGHRLAAVSVTTMWLLMLLVLWAENVITSTVIHLYHETQGLAWEPSIAYWQLAITSWEFTQIRMRGIDDLMNYMPLIWFDVYFSMFLVGVASLMLWMNLHRRFWCRYYRNATDEQLAAFKPEAGRKMKVIKPRLILSYLYQAAVIVFMITISVTAIAHYLKWDGWIVENILRLEQGSKVPHEIFMPLANVALVVIFGLCIFLGFAHAIRQAVKLALDVVNHFAAPGDGFPIRRRIANRFRQTLKTVLDGETKPHLVVICHSQGTVITLDTLFGYKKRDGTWQDGRWNRGDETDDKPLREQVASLTILSFGSPITHLYQYYFSSLYPRLAAVPELANLADDRREGSIRWYNSYRIDDYIGTHIDTSLCDAQLGDFPVNVPMSTGGHTRYWETDVFARLFAQPGMENVLVDTTKAGASAPPTNVQQPDMALRPMIV